MSEAESLPAVPKPKRPWFHLVRRKPLVLAFSLLLLMLPILVAVLRAGTCPLNGQDSVALRVGERASYNAEVWGSVGFQVECVVSDEKVVRLLNTRIEYLRADRPIPPGGDKGRKIFTFEAVSKGHAAITFREIFRGELKKTKEIRVAVLD